MSEFTKDFRGTGGQIIVEMLARQGVKRVSCVAGESYLAVLDALLDHPEIEVVTCRQEGGAAFIAESWGKLDGTVPGVCLVTRGPGPEVEPYKVTAARLAPPKP